MAKWRAEILSPWIVEANGQNSIQLSKDYIGLTGSDVTGQSAANIIPDPNLVVVAIECETPVLEAIEKNAAYRVLWSEEITEEVS